MADGGVRLHRLRVHDRRTRLLIAALRPADGLAKPVVQLGHQSRVPPAGEERIHAWPGREVGRHGPPLDAVVDEVAHRVDHLPVAVALRAAAPARQPSRHRQQVPHRRPLRIAHVRAIPRPALWPVGRIPEPVGDTVTPRSGRTGPGTHDHATLRQQGLLLLAGLDNRELPRGPSSMPARRPTHPIQHPVRTRPSRRTDREQPVRTTSKAGPGPAGTTTSPS